MQCSRGFDTTLFPSSVSVMLTAYLKQSQSFSGNNFRASLQQFAEFISNQSEDVLLPANQEQERKYLQFASRDFSCASCFPALGTDYTFLDVWQHFNFNHYMIDVYATTVIYFVIYDSDEDPGGNKGHKAKCSN